MSDLREKAARAVHANSWKGKWEYAVPVVQQSCLDDADAVICAIESDIRADERAKVLAQITQDLAPYLSTPLYRIYGAGGGTGTSGAVAVTLGDVLRSRQEAGE